MKKYLSLSIATLAVASFTSLFAVAEEKEISAVYEKEEYMSKKQSTDATWKGPGYYNGVWYKNEADFNAANRNRMGNGEVKQYQYKRETTETKKWNGPGYYNGVWYKNEGDYRRGMNNSAPSMMDDDEMYDYDDSMEMDDDSTR